MGEAPDEAALVVPLGRLLSEPELLERRGPLAASVAPDEDVFLIEPALSRLEAIFLHLPKFADGRAYSQARLLRQRLKFSGELRATGDVLRDQALYLYRCGFDVLALREDQTLEGVLASLSALTLAYQPGEDRALPLIKRLS
jgi:uncharacterized protein (DUF934 family)